MNRQAVTEHVKQSALRIGFDAVGVAEAVPLRKPMHRYRQWLQQGYHGMLTYMERNQSVREDVTEFLPGARSVVVVARNYYHPASHNKDAVGKISRYAWGDDYHDVLRPMLTQLSEEMQKLIPDSVCRSAVDSAPVLEKEWAVRAGIGWQGKHTNILRRDIGSWFFLGVIVTTADLVPDTPMEDFCGTCTACLDSCPTQALVQPGVLDATKCLSYWTIEVKPEHQIPAEIVNGAHGWLFGCDTCQDVCPWNRFQTETNEERFSPRNQQTALEPDYILQLSDAEFADRFRKSPIKRAKKAGLQRTARVLQTLHINKKQ
jgi:epoxyqueuosine reductase